MSMRRFYIFTYGLYASLGFSQIVFASETTFNCKEAANFVEKTTCTNPALLTLDQELASQLDTAEQVTRVPLKFLSLSQSSWAMLRNQCKNTSCIETAYKNRVQELKNLNLMSQDFVKYYIRTQGDAPDQNFAALQIQSLEENRLRILVQSFGQSSDKRNAQVIHFSGYANQGKRIQVKDLTTGCTLKLNRSSKNKSPQQWTIRQTSVLCGNKNVRFSGIYQQQS